MKKLCECGEEMYFDWGEPSSQVDPGTPPAWYCSGLKGCGCAELATSEEVRTKFNEEEEAFDIGG